MKNLIALTFLLSLLVGMLGCGSEDSTTPPIDAAKDAATQKDGTGPSATQD